DDAVSSRPGARFGPRAIRMAPTTWSREYAWSIQLETDPYAGMNVVDAGDAPVVPARLDRGLRVIHEKVFRVASSGAIPIVLGAGATGRRRRPSTGCASRGCAGIRWSRSRIGAARP